ncbi:MAG TPA: hypothetical protein VF177_15665 [Anaerolineae bacterium]
MLTQQQYLSFDSMSVQGLLLDVFCKLEREQIRYCLLRDADRLEQISQDGGEIDLLVQGDYIGQFANLVAQLGFRRLPSRGYAPHHFFVAYDSATDCWLKLDVVTECVYGHPVKALYTELAATCLERRRPYGPAYVLAPEDEIITLLLHCVLDKGYISDTRRERLLALCYQVTDEAYLSSLLSRYWLPTATWSRLFELISREQWPTLINEGRQVRHYLTKRAPMATLKRQWSSQFLRKMGRLLHGRSPTTVSVALLAPDGGGKSTLATRLQQTFFFPVRLMYMGLYQEDSTRLYLASLPGLRFVWRLLVQWWNYAIARYYQWRGQLIVFDRYSYDALLRQGQNLNRIRRWKRWLLGYALPAPDLVLLLDAPGEVLYQRKGEHSPNHLEGQRQQYLSLREWMPQIIVVDATQGIEEMRRNVTTLIWQAYLKH